VGTKKAIDSLEAKEENAESVRRGSNDIVPVYEFVNGVGLELGPAMFEGAFGVGGGLGVRAVGSGVPQASDSLVVAYDGRVVCIVNTEGSEDCC
jgi:hypothetical protein